MTWDNIKHLNAQRRTLGAPPAPTTTIGNLAQPETISERIDGRSLRATGRTAQLNIHVRPEFKHRVKILATTHNILVAELIERAVESYEHAQLTK